MVTGWARQHHGRRDHPGTSRAPVGATLSGLTSRRRKRDPAATASEFHLPLGNDERVVASALQRTLVDLIDLALIGKQAHWNVEGRQFRSLHLELDDLVDSWRTFADRVAERAVAIGALRTAHPSLNVRPQPHKDERKRNEDRCWLRRIRCGKAGA